MKKKSIWAFALIAMLTCLGRPAVASDGAFDSVEFVNPLMGPAGLPFNSFADDDCSNDRPSTLLVPSAGDLQRPAPDASTCCVEACSECGRYFAASPSPRSLCPRYSDVFFRSVRSRSPHSFCH